MPGLALLLLGTFCAVSSAAAPYDVVGLENLAVRLDRPIGAQAVIWMGERLGGADTEFIRVDPEGKLVLQEGGTFPYSVLYEFSENALLSVSENGLAIWLGKLRITSGLPAETHPILLRTAVGRLEIARNSIVDVEALGQRVFISCLAGRTTLERPGRNEPAAIDAGYMTQVTAGGEAAARPIPPDIRRGLERRPYLKMRYQTAGTRPPKLLWFSPMAGSLLSRATARLSGRVDPSDGPVEVLFGRQRIRPDRNGEFGADVKVSADADSLSVRFVKGESSGVLTIRVGTDLVPPEIVLDDIPETVDRPRALLAGKLSEDAVLLLSGKAVQAAGGRFSKLVDVAPGPNVFQLMAFDRAGHRTTREIAIFGGFSADLVESESAASTETAPAAELLPPVLSGLRLTAAGALLEFDEAPLKARYTIYRSYSSGGPFLLIGETAEKSFLDANYKAAGPAAFYRAALLKPDGAQSSPSEPMRLTVDASRVEAPAGLKARAEGGRLWLIWAYSPSPDIGGYNVYRIDADTPVRVASLKAPPYLSNLPDTFQELTFKVRAVSAHTLEESGWSEPAVVRP